MGGNREADSLIGQIRDIYQRWLDGDLSQEDVLFAIGDLLDDEADPASEAEHRPRDRPIVVVPENA